MTIEDLPIFNDDGQYEGSFAVIIDITEMKKIEHALRQSEKELKAKTNNLEEVNAALRNENDQHKLEPLDGSRGENTTKMV